MADPADSRAVEKPHYHGHRARLRERFEAGGADALADYELLELVLFRALPRRDVKPLAKALIARFGSFAEVLAARPERLAEVEGIGEGVVADLKLIEAAGHRLAKGAVNRRQALSTWKEVLAYCRAAMAFAEREEFRILFLDKRNALIADEVQGVGTVDHTPVYPLGGGKRGIGGHTDLSCRSATALRTRGERAMASLTDGAIRRAIKGAELEGKQKVLADGEGRGVGRLVLSIRPMPARVIAEWMAQQWRDGKRIKRKLGAYPAVSLAQARELFKRDYADAIQKGRSIKIAGDTRPGTVADLFEAYVASLKLANKPSWKETEKGLNKIADTLGRNRPAREIEPDEITDVLRPIFERGAPAMADHVRSYIRAAYSWGLKSEHDYRNTSSRRFRLVYNPAAGIPTEPKKVGTRWLNEDEFVKLWRWLECPDVPVHPPYLRAVQILMLTGQRVEEIARLHVDPHRAARVPGSRDRQQGPRAASLCGREHDPSCGSEAMTGKLRLGPLPRFEVVRLTIALPAAVKANLDRYAELFGAAYGETVDATALVPHMLAAFMERDRGFRRARQADEARPGSAKSSSPSIKAATSSTSDAAGDNSSE